MVTFKDLITGEISDSPSDRMAAPILLFLTFPVVIPCSAVYYSAKGVHKLGEVIKDKIDERHYYKEVEKPNEETITSVSEEPVVPTKSKKPKTLTLKMNNKKQM